MSAHEDFQHHNERYVAEDHAEKGDLALKPSKKLAVVACMDARINMLAHLGLKEGEAHIIRNAGGAAKDALRSLIISQRLLGTREIAVFHHTGCGMVAVKTPELRTLVKNSGTPGCEIVDNIDFLEFQHLEESVAEDVKWLKEHPLILPETLITGWVYEVDTGKIRRVA